MHNMHFFYTMKKKKVKRIIVNMLADFSSLGYTNKYIKSILCRIIAI